jgi:hypothetical protein
VAASCWVSLSLKPPDAGRLRVGGDHLCHGSAGSTAYGSPGRLNPTVTTAAMHPMSARRNRQFLAVLEDGSSTERGGCCRRHIASGLGEVRAVAMIQGRGEAK